MQGAVAWGLVSPKILAVYLELLAYEAKKLATRDSRHDRKREKKMFDLCMIHVIDQHTPPHFTVHMWGLQFVALADLSHVSEHFGHKLPVS